MIDWMRCGELPEKPHTVFRSPEGSVRYEECFTRRGFDGEFSILYHLSHPAVDLEIALAEPGPFDRKVPVAASHVPLKRRLFLGGKAPRGSPRFFSTRMSWHPFFAFRRKQTATEASQTGTETTFSTSTRGKGVLQNLSAPSPLPPATTFSCPGPSCTASSSRRNSKVSSSSCAADFTSLRSFATQ